MCKGLEGYADKKVFTTLIELVQKGLFGVKDAAA